MLRKLLVFVSVLVAVYAAVVRTTRNATTPVAAAPSVVPSVVGGAVAPTASPPAAVASSHSSVAFHSRAQLAEHFQKHGAEFKAANADEYLRMAQALRDATPGGDILEIVRPSDGVVSRFDRKSGAFIAFNRDFTIRTFFKPNDGEQYFRRQAKRSPAH